MEFFNHYIRRFPYKWGERINSPQALASSFASQKILGGNAHENWCLLRVFPFLIGHKVTENDLGLELGRF